MLSNNQSLYATGFVLIGFFIAGLFNILNNLIVQIVLGAVFLLIVINLCIVKPIPEDLEDFKK